MRPIKSARDRTGSSEGGRVWMRAGDTIDDEIREEVSNTPRRRVSG